jgi:large subunit ribosomal protein L17
MAKQGTLHSKREVASRVPHKEALKRLFQEIVPKFEDRSSGFSRVIKAGFRRGDNAEMSVVELLIAKPEVVEEKKETRLQKLSGKLKRPGKSAAKPEQKPRQKPPLQKSKFVRFRLWTGGTRFCRSFFRPLSPS